MPAGYSSKCKSCNSPHRLDIEAWHKDGKSPESIEVLLFEAFQEKISYRAIRNHLDEHYDVPNEVQKQYAQSQANLVQDASERLTEIEILDSVVQGKHGLHRTLEKIISNRLKGLEDTESFDDLPKLPMAYVSLYNGCAGEIRQCLKTKQELLGEDGKTKAAESFLELIELAESRPSRNDS